MEQVMPTDGPMSGAVTPKARELFNKMLTAREQKGIATYGTSLRSHNGRDAIRDALEECIDLFQYLVQIRLENDDLKEEMRQMRKELALTEAAFRVSTEMYDHMTNVPTSSKPH